MFAKEIETLTKQLQLLKLDREDIDDRELVNSPIFSEAARRQIKPCEGKEAVFSQYGLLGGDASKFEKIRQQQTNHNVEDVQNVPFFYYNVSAPSSIFICGSQGSGKSHTLSCILENCLLRSDANTLSEPLTGVVFHYDPFAAEGAGQPCEAAYLSSNPDVSVRVLCASSNVKSIKETYKDLPNVKVEVLRLSQRNLNTKRMLDLMAVGSVQGAMPLYLHVIMRILRDMRIQQQKSGGSFNYRQFKQALEKERLAEGQLGPLRQRLETLESFMAQEDVLLGLQGSTWQTSAKSAKNAVNSPATNWESEAGKLTIVDLSCPCVTAESACALFNICLGLFLEQNPETGRIVALDEAHKYMTESPESQSLTESLLATIRLQRHLGTRVVIATQEPTISPKLLDLCSVTIVHRFSSPDWLVSLQKHLAAVTPGLIKSCSQNGDSDRDATDPLAALFARIVSLRQGDALLFCPTALVAGEKSSSGNADHVDGLTDGGRALKDTTPCAEGTDSRASTGKSQASLVRLGCGILHIRVRERITADGGQSVMA